ncbi:N-glycosylase/DNA lyase [candidate division WOR-3 bacterium]|nr:N-glycosylase/DNA lyase [candidate division WOR-3 bacterium]
MKQKEVELKSLYKTIKKDIRNRLDEFSDIYKARDERETISEMIFCILTPQSKAKVCWSCIDNLTANEDIEKINKEQIKSYIKPIRFYNNKTEYIFELIEKIKEGLINIPDIFNSRNNIQETRDMLVKNIKGYGYKECSHFLRNIGMGENIAILDRHILRNLLLFDVIPIMPSSINGKKYIEIEDRMRNFTEKLNIPMAHLDILLWYKETGEIFK